MAIIERLRRFAHDHFRNDRQFGLRIGVKTGTTSRWFGPAASLPDAPALYRMLTEAHLSVDWLMTGEGPEMRGSGMPSGELSEALREEHVSSLVQLGVPRGEAEQFTPSGHDILQRALRRHAEDWRTYSAQVKLRKKWRKEHPRSISAALEKLLSRE